MSSIIDPWVFYWIEIADKLGKLFCIGLIIGGIFVAASFCTDDDGSSICGAYETKVRKIGLLIATLSLVCVIVLPSEETCYKMLTANMFTQDNINSATEYVTDVIDYAVDKVKELQPNTEE